MGVVKDRRIFGGILGVLGPLFLPLSPSYGGEVYRLAVPNIARTVVVRPVQKRRAFRQALREVKEYGLMVRCTYVDFALLAS